MTGNNMALEVQKAKLEDHHLVESVKVGGSNNNPKLQVRPTDAHARWQLEDHSWDEYTVYIELV